MEASMESVAIRYCLVGFPRKQLRDCVGFENSKPFRENVGLYKMVPLRPCVIIVFPPIDYEFLHLF